MIMFNRLPYFIILDEKKYKINVDFRNMISFEQDRVWIKVFLSCFFL